MGAINTLCLDLETYSPESLASTGVYKYAEHPDFDILLLAYSINDGPVKVLDLAQGEGIPPTLINLIKDHKVVKYAYNANFERICLTHWLRKHNHLPAGQYLNPAGWHCTMVWASRLGLPRSLKDVGTALGLPQQKMREGQALIRLFCQPHKPKTAQPGLFMATRISPTDYPEKWSTFIEYCRRDVEVETNIRKKLSRYPLPEWEWQQYVDDQHINDRGIHVDLRLAEQAILADERHRDECLEEAKELTKLENPNSPTQLLAWLNNQGISMTSMAKGEVEEALTTATGDIKRVLQLRQELSRSSVKKYQAMINATCRDGKAHGLLQFYGAGRTGRWAGRLIQVQNLPRNYLEDLDEARELLAAGHADMVEALYGSLPDTLSQLIRTAFVPTPGNRFIVADYSAIEARVLAWLAGEHATLRAFKDGKDLYCATASSMFGVPVKKHGVNAELRQKGKVASLACIAEGQRVLTNQGLIPIEQVTTDHKVWDGIEWVTHDGLINRGLRHVITYQGFTATPDHLVWVDGQPEPIPLGVAATSGQRLTQSGAGRHPLRLGDHHIQRTPLPAWLGGLLRTHPMQWLPQYPMDEPRQPYARALQGLSSLLPATSNTPLARSSTNRSKTALHQPRRPAVQALRRTRNRLHVLFSNRGREVGTGQPGGASRARTRPDRQRRALCAGEPTLGHSLTASAQSASLCHEKLESSRVAILPHRRHPQTFRGDEQGADYCGCGKSGGREAEKLAPHSGTARVYDLANAGPRHRFTVEDHLVHNCGYQGGVGAIKAMGGEKMGMTQAEMEHTVKAWREANPNITTFWWDVDQAAKTTITTGKPQKVGKIEFHLGGKVLFIKLPSGRVLTYPGASIGVNRFGGDSINFYGPGLGGNFALQETYGGKLVENITQAVSRDLLAHAIGLIEKAGHHIVMHIHDEVVIDAPPITGITEVCDLMSTNPPWADDLPLTADGYECSSYRKD